jgi:fatty acid desaturase
VTKRQSHRSKGKGNTLNTLAWVLLSVLLICVVLWAFTGATPLLFAALLSGLGLLYVVLFNNL